MLDSQALLPLLLLAPLVGALAMLLPASLVSSARQAWSIAMLSSAATLFIALVSVFTFDLSDAGEQLAFSLPWSTALGLNFALAVDGLSLWLVLTTAIIGVVVTIFVADKVERVAGDKFRQYFFWLMLTQFGVLGAFVARDLIVFYAFFELSITPAFFLIYGFGGAERKQAATTMLIYNLAASLLTFAALLYVAANHYHVTGEWSFALADVVTTAPMMSVEVQTVVLLGLLAGFLVKTPMWPLHTWLPNAHGQAPANGVVDAAALVIKLGPYALLQFALPLAPQGASAMAPCVAGLGVIGILVAGLICWVQTDIKKLLGFASVSHMGFCVIGLFALDPDALGATGAAFYVIVYGLSAGALFLCAGVLHDRFGTLSTDHIEGTAKAMPALAFFTVFFVIVSVGLPGLCGFVGEFLTLAGTFSVQGALGPWYAIFAVLGVIVTAIYLLRLTGKIIYGPTRLPPARDAADGPRSLALTGNEWLALAIPAVACLVLGFYPQPVLDTVTPVAQAATAQARTSLAAQSDAQSDAQLDAQLDVDRRPSAALVLNQD